MSGRYEDAGFVASSGYRIAVLKQLGSAPGMPSALAERCGFAIAHVSRSLGKLRDRGMVELLVDEKRKKGRIYGITERGENVLETLDEMEVEA